MTRLYEGFLTEAKLEDVLNTLFPDGDWIRNKSIPNSKRRFRPDFRSEHYKLIVEYDGHLHYTTAKGCVNDIEKYEEFKSLGYDFFNLPYFIQIDADVYSRILRYHGAKNILGLEFTDFPQGFVSKKCYLPADFCTAGLLRFAIEIYTKYNPQFTAIMESLDSKVFQMGATLVHPLVDYSKFLPENLE